MVKDTALIIFGLGSSCGQKLTPSTRSMVSVELSRWQTIVAFPPQWKWASTIGSWGRAGRIRYVGSLSALV